MSSPSLSVSSVISKYLEIGGPAPYLIHYPADMRVLQVAFKIQMEEVERALRSYMESNFMITKRSDKKFGEIVVLITENDNIAEVEAICKRVLPKYWCPHDYLHVESIPLTETGKPARVKALSLAEKI